MCIRDSSLDRHISQTWRFSTLLGQYVTPVPAQMRRGPFWFSGSADAIYQNLNLISDENPDLVGHVIPALTKEGVAHVYDFSRNVVPGQDDRERGYWRDVGTIDSYYT